MASKIEAQELEITNLKARVKLLEDSEGGEMVTVLTSLDAATVLSSGVSEVPTGSGSIPTAGHPAIGVPTGSEVVPTASPIFTTSTESTPYTRRKGKEKMVKSDTPNKKKLQEQIDVQVARELEEEMARDEQRMNEHIARDAEIARIHVEEELQMMIDGLDRNNETVAKYLQEYHQLSKENLYQGSNRKIFICQCSRVRQEEAERFKRKGLRLEQDSTKKVKTTKEHLDKEDLNQLWALVKETLDIRPAANDKEMELWVELKRLYEPDVED
uniref:Leucine-rich repeat protein n=1 Tax=Tanacetum cinerariifolium TaxID=118510 RepID=A0A699JHK4_TANCI|nr:leucine-rich repeat protein [Tanacetum cinerariifolium]